MRTICPRFRRSRPSQAQEMLGFTDPRIKEVRVMGGCTCVEVYDPKDLAGFRGLRLHQRGVFSRPS